MPNLVALKRQVAQLTRTIEELRETHNAEKAQFFQSHERGVQDLMEVHAEQVRCLNENWERREKIFAERHEVALRTKDTEKGLLEVRLDEARLATQTVVEVIVNK